KNGSVKVTRTDLHRCYSPISFTVIRRRILKQVSIVLLDILFLDIDVSIGLNTAMETAVKRVNSRSDWLDANQ
ncbi:hypothetical protein RNN60_24920, partial [Escherichia coli]|nr:hypothetical protein [Escherichia coli]